LKTNNSYFNNSQVLKKISVNIDDSKNGKIDDTVNAIDYTN